jgi:hypothetical protein
VQVKGVPVGAEVFVIVGVGVRVGVRVGVLVGVLEGLGAGLPAENAWLTLKENSNNTIKARLIILIGDFVLPFINFLLMMINKYLTFVF